MGGGAPSPVAELGGVQGALHVLHHPLCNKTFAYLAECWVGLMNGAYPIRALVSLWELRLSRLAFSGLVQLLSGGDELSMSQAGMLISNAKRLRMMLGTSSGPGALWTFTCGSFLHVCERFCTVVRGGIDAN